MKGRRLLFIQSPSTIIFLFPFTMLDSHFGIWFVVGANQLATVQFHPFFLGQRTRPIRHLPRMNLGTVITQRAMCALSSLCFFRSSPVRAFSSRCRSMQLTYHSVTRIPSGLLPHAILLAGALEP